MFMSKTNQSRISLRSRRGFTLVELIVVIAILGILAGIAIPVYSGYIKKANQAADNMLLSAVNTALGAARAENGFVELSDADVLVSSDKKITGITCTVLAAELTPAELVAVSFTTYFGDNVNTPLKYCDSSDDFEFHADTQTFSIVGSAAPSSSLSVTIGDKVYTYTQAQVDAYINSNYSHVDPAELTNSVDSLATALGDNKTGLAALANTAGFKAKLVALGVIDEGTEITAAMLNDSTLAQEVANASVLYVAQTASTMNPDQVYDAFVNGTIDTLVSGTGVDATFVTAALQYGLLTAFVNTDIGAEFKEGFMADSQNVHGLTDVNNLFRTYTNSPDTADSYQYYLSSNDAANDIKGFLSALSIINENAGNFDLSSVYSDPEIIAAINSILGNG